MSHKQRKHQISASLWASSAITESRVNFDAQWKSKKRAVMKNGDFNINYLDDANMRTKRKFMIIQDLFTTVVDLDWPWVLLLIFITHIFMFTTFGLYWWYLQKRTDRKLGSQETEKMCVHRIISFATSFLFSMEVAYAVGFGFRTPTEFCIETLMMLCLQLFITLLVKGAMTGLVFGKVSRPEARSSSVIFSKFACISTRNGVLCLMFRVADVRRSSHLVACSVRAVILRRKVFPEGEDIHPYMTELVVSADSARTGLFLWPVTFVHIINSDSPLYKLSATDLLNSRFEIVVMVEGASDSTGKGALGRTSYIPNEILWGYRFFEMQWFDQEKREYVVDYKEFDTTINVKTDILSAYQIEKRDSASTVSLSQIVPDPF